MAYIVFIMNIKAVFRDVWQWGLCGLTMGFPIPALDCLEPQAGILAQQAQPLTLLWERSWTPSRLLSAEAFCTFYCRNLDHSAKPAVAPTALFLRLELCWEPQLPHPTRAQSCAWGQGSCHPPQPHFSTQPSDSYPPQHHKMFAAWFGVEGVMADTFLLLMQQYRVFQPCNLAGKCTSTAPALPGRRCWNSDTTPRMWVCRCRCFFLSPFSNWEHLRQSQTNTGCPLDLLEKIRSKKQWQVTPIYFQKKCSDSATKD